MWLRKQPQKRSLKEEATPPPGYVSAPPGYRYWSPTPSSSPNYYRKRLKPDEAPNSSRRSLRRRVLSIVLIAILTIDLVAMVYGGYLSSWQLLTQPSGILSAVVGLIALIGLLASAYEKIFSPGVRRTISRNAPLVSALIALIGVLITQIVNTHLTRTTQENQQLLDQEARQNSELQSYLSTVGGTTLELGSCSGHGSASTNAHGLAGPGFRAETHRYAVPLPGRPDQQGQPQDQALL